MKRIALLSIVVGLVFFGLDAGDAAARAAGDAPAVAQLPSFEEAWRRERVELEALRKALRGQLRSLERRNERQRRALEADVERLVSEVAAARRSNATLLERAEGLEEQVAVAGDGGDQLAATLEVARQRLRPLGVEVPTAADAQDGAGDGLVRRYTATISAGLEALHRWRGVVRVEGAFFDGEGRKVDGTIVHLGRVAAFGVAESSAGTLVPAPGGTMRVYDAAAADTARRVAVGEPLDAVSLYLFDPLSTAPPAQEDAGLVATADAGGPIAWIIVALACLGVLLVAERALSLAKNASWRPGGIRRVCAHAERGELAAATRTTSGMGALGRVLRRVLAQSPAPRSTLEEHATEETLRVLPRFERSLALLNVIVVVSPLLGLLGTVTGIISTFDVITEHGTGDPKLLSHGISEALITTKFGLGAAVPLLLLRSMVGRWAERSVAHIQLATLALVNVLAEKAPASELADSDKGAEDGDGDFAVVEESA